jgi:hypothetical protein
MPKAANFGKRNVWCKYILLRRFSRMAHKQLFLESELAGIAKKFRLAAGKKKAPLGRELGVTRATMQDAEERPENNLTKLRRRIVEACSPYKVEGPFYRLVKK